MNTQPLLQISELVKHYPVGRSMFGRGDVVHALDGVSLTLDDGQTLAVVGESGCGKSTLARCLVRLVEPTSGSIRLADCNVAKPNSAEQRRIPRLVQIVFQDPYASLNPRRTIYQTVADPLRLHAPSGSTQRRAKVAELLAAV
ncbi:MAG: ATP-binding cassette domain-containing protein, partial [Burkholderiaceae bacterium]|nr:ATP-binding cassette domain-containing protein [Burkholderiaceae bacterium]